MRERRKNLKADKEVGQAKKKGEKSVARSGGDSKPRQRDKKGLLINWYRPQTIVCLTCAGLFVFIGIAINAAFWVMYFTINDKQFAGQMKTFIRSFR
mmetsp:Transcript_34446/g.67365  ORF Transcript_34446/g.67365 Transcript_34446/m.67365 type:complete len:97 (-) Transcript_34446:1148-1438(-)|eukprot:CAMPEP_0173385804 /NCGR_PEP_ID=MMETSP1356-20130122/8411_1 /TAXON_ID=77927 ORGANISM="Hemiselmis virescens, Strain PCC157" /NCGR_SAMPLE_ID=MMETSP1356 /ASSEMBLY_ACC=CAM_ASM_000847 /LENGTH=96 /DNA_ID=CAMNT_0014341767 /DNA_START=142 /DNA_END=432 /DNA_ORIENTATION=-